MTRYIPAILLLLLSTLPLAAKPNALPPPVVPQCIGVNIHFTGQPTRDLDGLESAGVGWVRMDFAWADVEKTRGVYDFSAYDSLVTGLTARYIRPLFILDYGNPLYETGPPTTQEARAAFARFAAAAASHYRGRSVLWELWNEPNGVFWPPKPDVLLYGALALAAAHAIRVADPGATIIAPGTSGIPLDYLESLFRQGLLNEVDAVSVHPYRSGLPETAEADDQALRLLIHRYAPPGKDVPLVWSEWGYTNLLVNETQQAQFLTRAWLCGLSDGVRVSIWYDWHDDGTNPLDPEAHFGMVHADYSLKPAYLAARELTHVLGGCRFVKRVPLASPEDYLLLFSRGDGQVRLAAWTAGAAHEILLPIAAASALTGMTGDAVGPSFLQGRLRLPLSGSPVYLTVPQDEALRQAAAWTVTPDDSFFTASQALHWSLAYHNPDQTPHRVRFEALMTTESGERRPVPGGIDDVGAGATLNLGIASLAPARVPVRVRVGLSVDGVLQPYPQDIDFLPTDPIRLSVLALSAGGVRVDLANPSGEEFLGTLSTVGATRILPITIHLTVGQTALSLTLADPHASSWLLSEANGVAVASTRVIPQGR